MAKEPTATEGQAVTVMSACCVAAGLAEGSRTDVLIVVGAATETTPSSLRSRLAYLVADLETKAGIALAKDFAAEMFRQPDPEIVRCNKKCEERW